MIGNTLNSENDTFNFKVLCLLITFANFSRLTAVNFESGEGAGTSLQGKYNTFHALMLGEKETRSEIIGPSHIYLLL